MPGQLVYKGLGDMSLRYAGQAEQKSVTKGTLAQEPRGVHLIALA